MRNFNLNTLMPLNTNSHDAEPTSLEEAALPTVEGYALGILVYN